MSYRGALGILGKHDRPIVDALDRALGGVILASGAVPGAAIFGWVDQKNEAVGLIRKLLDSTVARLGGTSGRGRTELITAAHTAIVCVALFDALRAQVGPLYAKLEITDEEKRRLALRAEPAADVLYHAEVPIPSALEGFHETAESRLFPFYRARADGVITFLGGLAAWQKVSRSTAANLNPETVAARAVKAYRDMYLGLAAEVPEFLSWASFGEHAATRAAMRRASDELRAAFRSQSQAFSRLERILTVARPPTTASVTDPRTVLHSVNRAILDQPLLPADSMRHLPAIRIPAIQRSYVTPQVRVGVNDAGATPSTEAWWLDRPKCGDLDLFLAAHFESLHSTELPLILLGHPGAGKSLLTKVLAARLPAKSFTVVRVQLRRVDADAPVYQQVEQALRETTNGRVSWPALSEAAREQTRVVLLDGFDELLQASAAGKAGYLQQVAEFQRTEASIGCPVAVVVTSRTLVVDRATIPEGCTIVKLEDFDKAQVGQWLEVWRTTNARQVEAGAVRALSTRAALRYAISHQPLLLLMLALYAADPGAADLEVESLSVADLYGQLLDNFIRREIAKEVHPDDAGFALAAQRQLWHLGVAAFGMFNRGMQSISDESLNADLLSLPDPPSPGLLRPAQRTVGHFFFVHTAESDGHRAELSQRSYEFLHATFGEYLVAYHIVTQLAELSVHLPPAGRRVDDELLFALLSHQTLTTREAILPFARELFTNETAPARERILALLSRLAAQARRRHSTHEFDGYPPMSPDPIHALAAYTGNLTLLRVHLAPEMAVRLADLTPAGTAPDSHWRSTVWLWHAGLDPDSRSSLIKSLSLDGIVLRWNTGKNNGRGRSFEHLATAYLSGELGLARSLRTGIAVTDGGGTLEPPAEDALLAFLSFFHTRRSVTQIPAEKLATLLEEAPELSTTTRELALRLANRLVRSRVEREAVVRLVRAARPRPGDTGLGKAIADVALLVAADPGILDDFPEFEAPSYYRPALVVSAEILRLGELMHQGAEAQRLRRLWRGLDPSTGAKGLAQLLGTLWTTSK